MLSVPTAIKHLGVRHLKKFRRFRFRQFKRLSFALFDNGH
jgi:hypothetical protein